MVLFRIFGGGHIDFFTDRLCRIYSIVLFLLLATSLAWEFHYNSLVCYPPSHFNSMMAVYTQVVCQQSGSSLYDVPFSSLIPKESEMQLAQNLNLKKLRYLPVVLVGQSLLFLLPWLFWKLVSGGCCSLQGMVNDSAKMTSSNDPRIGRTVTSEVLKLQSSGISIVFMFSYLLSKAMYWAVCLIQLGILAWFLDIDFFRYRYNTHMYDPYEITTADNNTALAFPRRVLCDFQIRQLGNIRRYTIECAAPISEVIERYLYVIWAWLVTLTVLMALSGMLYFFKSIFWLIGLKSYKNSLIKRNLADVNGAQSTPQNVVDKFGNLYLKPGMLLAFDILAENGSLHAVSLAVNNMWEEFLSVSKLGDDVQVCGGGGGGATYTPMVEMGGGAVNPTPAAETGVRPGPYHSVQEELKSV